MKPSFAFLLRDKRKRAGWTQSELAARLGVSQRRVSYYETEAAYPDFETLQRIGAVFGCSLDEFGTFAGDEGRFGPPRGFANRFGRAPRAHRPTREVSMYARLQNALEKYPEFVPLYRRLESAPWFHSFVRLADCNSAEEAVANLVLASQGARFGRFTHSRLGWSGPPIVDRRWSSCLTGLLWPTLFLETPRPMVFFPQVRILSKKTRLRVDLNVALGGQDRSEFFGVEVLGGGHRDQGDSSRADHLSIPVLFVRMRDLRSENLAAHLLDRYLRQDWQTPRIQDYL